MNKLFVVGVIGVVAVGGWWAWNNNPTVFSSMQQYIENGDLQTLEARYSPEHIMEAHRKELVPNAQYTYQEPEIRFYPHLMIDAKYTHPDKKTREGVLIWSLVDGEIVLDTDTWETTHGFEDAINARATRNDFRILYALARNNGSMTRDQLQKDLHIEAETLEPWINSAAQKRLIVIVGGELQLHLQNPKIAIMPQTKHKKTLVTRPYSYSQCMDKKYSRNQIETTSQAAFGSAFTIRTAKEIYLPVHCIRVQNPDGSILTTYWNALSGQQVFTSK
jgi:hypothetical protein